MALSSAVRCGPPINPGDTMSYLNDEPVWVVSDPSHDAVRSDAAPYYTTFGRLAALVAGTGVRRWHAERTALYDDEDEAQADADERWVELQRRRATWVAATEQGS